MYLNGTKKLKTGTELQFDGTNLGVGIAPLASNQLTLYGSSSAQLHMQNSTSGTGATDGFGVLLSGLNVTMTNHDIGYIALATSDTERLRINSAGNMGLGNTPQTWDTGIGLKAFQFSTTGCIYSYSFGGNNFTTISDNFYINSSGTGTYLTTNTASQYRQTAGAHQWFQAASGTAGNAITFTQAMTLDASGNLLLSKTTADGNATVDVNGVIKAKSSFKAKNNTSNLSYYEFEQNAGASAFSYIGGDGRNTGFINFSTNDTERARIDSSGRLLVGFTSYANIGNVDGQAFLAGGAVFSKNTTSNTTQINFYNPNGGVGTINTSGTSTSYNTSSDYRLKNTIAPMTGALAKVALLKPVTYKWNCDGSDSQGFIAHELAEVVPDCVSGEKDAVDKDGNPKYQGIDTSFLVATLTAAIQEQQALIQSLKARLDAANL
jgi:hypothetical protein